LISSRRSCCIRWCGREPSGVGRDLQAGADLLDLGRLFEQRNALAGARQTKRRGEAAYSGARHDEG